MNDNEWFSHLEFLNEQSHNLLLILKQKFPKLKILVAPDKIRCLPIVTVQLNKQVWQFTIVDDGDVVAEVLQPIKGQRLFLDKVYYSDIDTYIKELQLVKEIQSCIKNYSVGAKTMETIFYDSRSYTFYQFWGDLVNQTGFNALDYQSITVEEQSRLIATAILESNVLVDYDGKTTDFDTVALCVENILESNILSE